MSITSLRSIPLLTVACLAAGIAFGSPAAAQTPAPGKLTVRVDQPGARFDPMFYGLMTEEINYSYDGGLYAELIRNRIFREPLAQPGRGGRGRGAAADPNAPPPPPAPAPIPYWNAVTKGNAKASISTDTANPVNSKALTTSLKLTVDAVGPGERAGVANDGFWGIPTRPNTTYTASFYARGQGATGPLNVSIESADGNTVYASGTVPAITGQWEKYTVKLTTGATVPASSGFTVIPPTAEQIRAAEQAAAAQGAEGRGGGRGRGGFAPQPSGRVDTRFVISTSQPGTVWFNLVSLFPPTYKNRVNGMRADLMELLAGLKPAYLRFPGGNYLEGPNYENRFDWKATIGPLEERPGHQTPWTYRSSDGVGLLEFLNWCEDLNMEPVVGLYAGLHIDQGQNILTGDRLKPHVEEALEEIEYIIGDTNTKWGALRAQHGHPAPYKLRYVQVGNEDWLNQGGPSYDGRFTLFYDAIKAKYPQLKVISSGRFYNNQGQQVPMVTSRTPDVIDEHYYMNYYSALTIPRRYEDRAMYPRTPQMPRVFVGEWATRDNLQTPSFRSALSDAAYLAQLEQYADFIIMTCYAPLLVNVNPGYPQYQGGPNYPGGQQWATDLIGYNSLSSFGSTSYYVQKLYAQNRGDAVLPHQIVPQVTPEPLTPPPGRGRGGAAATAPAGATPPPAPLFASATREDATGDVILKVVNYRDVNQHLEVDLQGLQAVRGATGEIITGDPNDVNTIAEPTKVAPKPLMLTVSGPKFTQQFPANSVSVIRIKTR